MTRLGIGVGGLEIVVGGTTPAASCEPWHATGKSLAFEKTCECLATTDLLLLRVASTFDVQMGTHQRVPPSSPRIHSSPRRYFSSHTLRASADKRVILVLP